jgi:hypothetical protein
VTSSYLISCGFVLALGFVSLAQHGSCQTKSNNSPRALATSQANDQAGILVTQGVWGGDHIRLEVGDTSSTIEYDCANGTISGALKLDNHGRFRARGTHVREHGGPMRNDETPVNHPADYSGNVNGNQMTLTVSLTDSSERVGTFTLVRGIEGNLVKCR